MSSAHRRSLGLVLAVLAVVWAWNNPWLLPLKLLVVLLHESGHALMAVFTGGEVRGLTINADESGAVRSLGGSPILTLNAGYLGSAAWGLGLLAVSRRPALVRIVCGGLAAFFVFVALAWARPIVSFGFFWVLSFSAGFALLARYASPLAAALMLRALGLFSILYALGDILDDVLLRPGAPSDASLLAEHTGIPALVWGLAWTTIAALALWRALRS